MGFIESEKISMSFDGSLATWLKLRTVKLLHCTHHNKTSLIYCTNHRAQFIDGRNIDGFDA